MVLRRGLALILTAAAALPSLAAAQSQGLIVDPALLPTPDRDHNVSVADALRPDYDPLGFRAGSFVIHPLLQVGLGYDSNIYLAEDGGQGSALGTLDGDVRVNSDWSRHQLSADVSGGLTRYPDHSRRNESVWHTEVQGRYDAGTNLSVAAHAEAGKVYESPFSGAVEAQYATLSSYVYDTLWLRGTYTAARTRVIAQVTHSGFSFGDIDLPGDASFDQAYRDRTVNSVASEAEYALSPLASLYAQVSYTGINYGNQAPPGVLVSDSDTVEALVGISADLPSFLRGTVGVGYIARDYDAAGLDRVHGLSFEANLQYFYSDLTTFNLSARRVIQDATLLDAATYFDTRFQLRVDHELLRNLILNATAQYSNQRYIGDEETNNVYQVGVGGRFLVSRLASVSANAFVIDRERSGGPASLGDGSLHELRALVTLALHP